MGWRRDLTDLVDMYGEGGLAIVTPLSGESKTAAAPVLDEKYEGKEASEEGVRTILQIDSDMVTIMSEDVLENPDVWLRHTQAVNRKLAVLGRLPIWLRRSWILFLPFSLAPLLVSARYEEIDNLFAWALSGLLATSIGLARKRLMGVVLPLVARLATWYLQRRFQQFIAGA